MKNIDEKFPLIMSKEELEFQGAKEILGYLFLQIEAEGYFYYKHPHKRGEEATDYMRGKRLSKSLKT